MLFFAVPPDSFESEEDQVADGKASLDESDISPDGGVPRALQKVELDLDDAPFLEEEDEEEAAPVIPDVTGEGETPAPARRRPAFLHPKFLLLGLIGLVLVAGLSALGYLAVDWLMSGEPEAPPAEEVLESIPQEQHVGLEYTVRMEPYWVEKTDPTGQIRFVRCSFAFIVTTQPLTREMEHKKLVLRDAVYYYLKNKPYAFLADPAKLQELKSDLLSVLNKYLGEDKIKSVLIEEYVVQ